jgi:DNA polymerase-1
MELNQAEKSKLYGILQNMKDRKDWRRSTNSNILLVDGTNLFIRGWAATNSMSENGNLVGGVVASLKSLGYANKLIAPTRCVVVFDGAGGSVKRRKLFPDYKSHRKNKIRLNRAYEEMSDAPTEEESCRHQYQRFVQYLQILPVNLLSIDLVEADDVLAYLATDYFKDSEKVHIMSSDRDFLQLCDGRVQVYSPTKKRIYGPAEVLNDYHIHPNNFVLYRALDGDDSDDIPGIELAGPKTIVKHFPWLNESSLHTVDEVIKHADGFKNKYKVCENICNGKAILDRNVALMQLKDTALTTIAQLHCNEVLQAANIPMLDRNAFIKMVREDGIDANLPNHVNWLQDTFALLDSVTRKE